MFLAGLLLMLLNCACALLPRAAKESRREPKGAEGSRREGLAGREAGDTTPQPASQQLASDRRDWETQGDKWAMGDTGDKRKTRGHGAGRQRHSIWH